MEICESHTFSIKVFYLFILQTTFFKTNLDMNSQIIAKNFIKSIKQLLFYNFVFIIK